MPQFRLLLDGFRDQQARVLCTGMIGVKRAFSEGDDAT
jgi:hypothetical protein